MVRRTRAPLILIVPILLLSAWPAGAAGIGESGVELLLDTFEHWGISEADVDADSFDVRYRTQALVVHGEIFGPPDASVTVTRGAERLAVVVSRPAVAGGTASTGTLELLGPPSVSLNVRTTTGQITVQGLRAGSLTARTANGRISVSDSHAPVRIVSKQGDIHLMGIEGVVVAETTRGAIDAVNVVLTGDSRFRSTSGNIVIDVAGKPEELELHLASEEGSVEINGEAVANPWIASGGEVRLEVRTGRGDIRVY